MISRENLYIIYREKYKEINEIIITKKEQMKWKSFKIGQNDRKKWIDHYRESCKNSIGFR